MHSSLSEQVKFSTSLTVLRISILVILSWRLSDALYAE